MVRSCKEMEVTNEKKIACQDTFAGICVVKAFAIWSILWKREAAIPLENNPGAIAAATDNGIDFEVLKLVNEKYEQ